MNKLDHPVQGLAEISLTSLFRRAQHGALSPSACFTIKNFRHRGEGSFPQPDIFLIGPF
jgi:hypothetical protein